MQRCPKIAQGLNPIGRLTTLGQVRQFNGLNNAILTYIIDPELQSKPDLNLDTFEEGEAEEDTMDVTNADDEAMAAMMGFGGFGTTKVTH